MPDVSDALSVAEVDRKWDPLTPWEDPAWRARALAWVQERLAELGRRAAPDGWWVRVRPWSVIFRIPLADSDVLWFKANPPASAYEPSLLRLLAEHHPDRVVAPLALDAERGWSLQPHGGTVFRTYLDHDPAASIRDWEAAVGQYAAFQRDLLPHTEAIAALGIPRCPTAALPKLVEELIGAVSLADGEHAELRARLPRYAAWCAELASLGIPDGLDHADLHDNQILGPDASGGYRFFDWGDAIVGHPFASLRVTFGVVRDRFGPDTDLTRLRDAYLEPWTDAGPSPAELRRAVTLARRVGLLGRALAWGRVFEEHRARLGGTLDRNLAETLRSVGTEGD
ncbi:aminoglycoside phosphotransferase family protein [Catenulispora subtropica]|uniref:Phosphotransferase n=1 Tax=Catenulispora subtropica TaxID=450798 RepID=A0ABP5E4S1_9ACTN